MDQTDIWMLGVIAFGAVFYLCSLYFQKVGGKQGSEDAQD